MEQTALFDFVLRKRADCISFALGLPNPDFFPVADLGAAASAAFGGSADICQYNNTLDQLNEHIAALMAARGVTCAPEQIMLTNGAQHGIDMAVRLLHDPGDPVVVEEVTYTGALAALSMRNARIHTIPVDTAKQSMAAAVESLIRAGVRPALVYVMPEGHNPLGVSMPTAQRRALVELAREHELTIVEDDAYGFLQYTSAPRPALRALDDRRVVYVGSFSKIVSPGLRVGWMVVPDALARKAALIKEASALDVATPGQYLVTGLLDRWDIGAHINLLRREYALRRDTMRQCLDAIAGDGITISHPDSGMFFWMELPEGVDTGELLTAAVAHYGVSFVSGEVYFADPARAKRNCLRLSFSCVSPREIEQGAERLQKLLTDRGIT